MGFKERYENAKHRFLKDANICRQNRSLFKKFFAWEEEKLRRINDLANLDESSYKTLYAYIIRLRIVNKWFNNKPWKDLTVREIKQVYKDLEDGKITNRKGKRFEDRRSYYNKIFKAKPFQLAGKQGEVQKALEFFTDRRRREVRFVNPENFHKMVGVLSKPTHLALFWLAWDIGENINSILKLTKNNFKKQINRDTREPEYLIHLPKDRLKRSRQTRSEPTLFAETVAYLDMVLPDLKDDELVFPFGYRQALNILDGAVKRSGAKCEPNGEKPSWKDLRSGMACNLFFLGWHSDDINPRLGHSITSRELDVYLNYMAQNRSRAKKQHYSGSLQDVKNELEEARQREKLHIGRIERQRNDLREQERRIAELEKSINNLREFDSIASDLLTDQAVQKVLLRALLRKRLGKKLMELCDN